MVLFSGRTTTSPDRKAPPPWHSTAQQPSTGTDALVALAGTLTLEEKVALVVGAGLWTR